MKNGHDPHRDDPKVASLSAARKKAEAARRAAAAGNGARRSIGEWLVGAAIVAMAVGLVVWLTRPLWQGALALAP